MRVLIPFTVEDSNLLSSSIPENDYPVWSSVTSYVAGDLVISTVTHRIYEALQNSTNIDPTTDFSDPPYWLNIGATNRWKAFDQLISDPVTVPDGVNIIQYELGALGVPANSITLFGLKGRSATVVATDATEGEIYSETINLIDNALVNEWYTYFFEPARVKSEAIFEGIPPYANATFNVSVFDDTAEEPLLGQVVLGQEYILGETNYGTSVSIDDFSRKERDAFGNAIIVERPFAKLIDFDFVVNTNEVRRSAILLEQVRATPAVYYAGPDTERYGTTVYGFYRSFSINLSGPAISNVTLEVEGLT